MEVGKDILSGKVVVFAKLLENRIRKQEEQERIDYLADVREKAALAFGEYTNVQNAPEVLLLLLLQAGSTLITEDAGEYHVLINQSGTEMSRPPADAGWRVDVTVMWRGHLVCHYHGVMEVA